MHSRKNWLNRPLVWLGASFVALALAVFHAKSTYRSECPPYFENTLAAWIGYSYWWPAISLALSSIVVALANRNRKPALALGIAGALLVIYAAASALQWEIHHSLYDYCVD